MPFLLHCGAGQSSPAKGKQNAALWFSYNALGRPLVIPSEPAVDGTAPSLCAHDKNSRQSGIHPRRYGWAELLQRVFWVDVLVCAHCGGRLRILSAIIPLDAIVKILECLGRPYRPPPISPAEPDRDPEFFIN
jgi:hypothetical protein